MTQLAWVPWCPYSVVEARLCNDDIISGALFELNLTGAPPNGPTTIVALRLAVEGPMTETDDILGPPALVWRDDPLFNQGHVAAELAVAALRELENGEPWAETDAEHAIERLEAFLNAAREEASSRASA
jgi:hypothetical protein